MVHLEAFVCPSNRKAQTTTGASGNVVQKLGPSDYRGNMAAGYVLVYYAAREVLEIFRPSGESV